MQIIEKRHAGAVKGDLMRIRIKFDYQPTEKKATLFIRAAMNRFSINSVAHDGGRYVDGPGFVKLDNAAIKHIKADSLERDRLDDYLGRMAA